MSPGEREFNCGFAPPSLWFHLTQPQYKGTSDGPYPMEGGIYLLRREGLSPSQVDRSAICPTRYGRK